ncbi:DUF262 domain-containing HNH endonuclease family protein [Bacillus paramycoides]|uniref:DUF262 domain-containing protein n=1 Tax=Bacillus paramycoides TaxID=2026194 RepID=UPI002E20DCC5|nr:DUF262 domain-containing HNH endonuclease family protein [Bacillus paramycoides]
MSIQKQFHSDGLVNVTSLLNGQDFYKIPVMQRNYVWNKENLKEFVNDIKDSMLEDDQQDYFIGSMVFSEDETNLKMVIDGQQRITSITLLIGAAIYHFGQEGFTDFQNYYQPFLKKSYPGPKGEFLHNYRLTHHTKDNDFYKNILEYNPNKKYFVHSTSQLNLLKAMETLIEFIDPNDGFPLKEFMTYLTSKVYIVSMVSGSINMAFRIFETLNDRGTKLQPEDLLKNMLLRDLNDEQYNRIANIWDKFITQLTDDKGKPIVNTSTFLKHFLMSKGYLVQKKNLYSWFESQAASNSPDEKNKRLFDLTCYSGILQLVTELEEAASIYLKAIEGNISPSINACLQLGVKQTFIIVLAANKLHDDLAQEIFNKLETLMFSFVISSSRFNELEKQLPLIALKIRAAHGRDGSFIEALQKLQDLINNKKEIALTSFENYKLKGSDKKKVSYILSKLAASFDEANYSNLTIEHIMPEDKKDHWEHIKETGPDYKNLVSRIGNLTLLSKSENSSLKNKSFNDKKLVYKNQSSFTRSIVEKIETGTKNTKYDKVIKHYNYEPASDTWNTKEIDRRSKALRRLAEYVWFHSNS